jgi:hypothetical protein
VGQQLTGAVERRLERSFENLHPTNLGRESVETIREMFGIGSNSVQRPGKLGIRNEELGMSANPPPSLTGARPGIEN